MEKKEVMAGECKPVEFEIEELKLERLLDFDSIVIQCHNNPDADAIACGYGILTYLCGEGYQHSKNNSDALGKTVRFVYGDKEIQKPNLCLFAEYLDNSLECVSDIGTPDLLLYVDCQPGERNVQNFGKKQDGQEDGIQRAVIDHHQVRNLQALPSLRRLCNYGSCATLVWQMLKEAKYNINGNEKLATALYYGLFTDTNRLEEIFHPYDKDMRDQLKFNASMITFFRNSNTSVADLKIISGALGSYQAKEGYDYNTEYRFAVLEASGCDDQNILGIISDMLIEVHRIDTCVVYLMYGDYAQLSVRSCIREVRANELVKYLCINEKNGGGHLAKAGGKLFKENVEQAGKDYGPEGVQKCLYDRMLEYFTEEDIFYAVFEPGNPLISKQKVPDLSEGIPFLKKAGEMRGFVWAGDIVFGGKDENYSTENAVSRYATEEKEIVVRMMEGDFLIDLTKGDYIMLGVDEVYPIKKEDFENKYMVKEESYHFDREYSPTVRSALTGESVLLLPYAKICISKAGASRVYGIRLERRTKLFTEWGDAYMLGEKGDWLVGGSRRAEDGKVIWDMWIVKEDTLEKNYEREQ